MEAVNFNYLPAYTPLFQNCAVGNPDAEPLALLQGGSGSGKTIQALTLALAHMANNIGFECVVMRKTLTECRKTVFKDAQNAAAFTGQEHLFEFRGGTNGTMMVYCPSTASVMHFMGVDDPEKLKGLSASIQLAIMDELTGFQIDDLKQLKLRLRCPFKGALNQIICTFNPIDKNNWVYRELIEGGRWMGRALYMITTFRHNPKLPKSNRLELIAMIQDDPQWAECYAFGRWINRYEHQIYTTFDTAPYVRKGRAVYGLDFGFVHPMALVEVNIRKRPTSTKHGDLYVKQLIYESEMSLPDLIHRMRFVLKIPRAATIICDSARPEMIKEIKKTYPNARAVVKGAGSVFSGIMAVKRFNIIADEDSPDLINELESYRWKKTAGKDGVLTDEPVKKNDDAMDALRYGATYLAGKMGMLTAVGASTTPPKRPSTSATPAAPQTAPQSAPEITQAQRSANAVASRFERDEQAARRLNRRM